MTFSYANSLATRTRIEYPEFSITARSNEQVPVRVERKALNRVSMTMQHRLRLLRVPQIEELDEMVASGRSENVVRSRVEQNLADTFRRHLNAGDGIKVLRFPVLLPPPFEHGILHFPDHDFAIFGAGRDDGVVEWRPVGVEDSGGVAARERNEVGEFVGKVVGKRVEGGGEGEDREGTASGRVPVNTDVFLASCAVQ